MSDGTLSERERLVYSAKLAELAERYDGTTPMPTCYTGFYAKAFPLIDQEGSGAVAVLAWQAPRPRVPFKLCGIDTNAMQRVRQTRFLDRITPDARAPAPFPARACIGFRVISIPHRFHAFPGCFHQSP